MEIIILLYYLTFWLFLGATPGKILMGLRIVSSKTYSTPSALAYIIRYLSYSIATAPLLIGLLWVIFDKNKQGWHDKIAKTLVVVK